MKISILNAGQQTDYLYGLVSGLSVIPGIEIEVVDSTSSVGVVDRFPNVRLYNLRGDNISKQNILKKSWLLILYYARLAVYAWKTESGVFHIQWENSIALIDRILLNLYYKSLGKKLLFTAHNVYREERDGRGGMFSRLTTKMMYTLVDCIIVHTVKMKEELCSLFGIPGKKVFVIRHGINNRIDKKGITKEDACGRLGIDSSRRTLLFFGQIDEYKGLDILIGSMPLLLQKDPGLLLMIVGKLKRSSYYIDRLLRRIDDTVPEKNIMKRFEFVPAGELEWFFSAADCLILPYKKIFQSGIIFLAYRLGVPVIATDVGSFREDIIEGRTGFICRREDEADLARKIESFFDSRLYTDRMQTRLNITAFAEQKYSWTDIGRETYDLYLKLEGKV
jgi:D-inositol-3-phosphate glycosyltransferase